MKAEPWTGRPSRKNNLAYKIQIHPSAQKQLLGSVQGLPEIEIVQAIDRLAEKPRPSACKKLKGTETLAHPNRPLPGNLLYNRQGIENNYPQDSPARQEDTYKNF